MSTIHDGPTAMAPAPGVPPAGGPPRAGRRWWRVVGSIVAVFILSMTLLQVVAVIARSTETIRRTIPADGVEHVDVRANSGDVVVTGTGGDEVRIVARVEHGLFRTKVRIRRDGDTLRASSSCPPFPGLCSVGYTIEIPRGMRVVARSDNGDVTVRDLDGVADVSSSNGDVLASDLSGDARLESSNGDVTGTGLRGDVVTARSRNGNVTVELGAAPRQVEATSSNGDVDVALPDDGEAYALDMSTANGNSTGQIRTDPDSARRLHIRSSNGDVAVRYRLG